MSHEIFTDRDLVQDVLRRRKMSPPEPPEDDPVEQCEECGAHVQDDVAAVERVCWRCGEAL